MKKDFTKIVFILDESGSMGYLRDDTIGGFNSMIEDKKTKPGTANVTTVLFNNEVSILHDNLPLSEVKPLTRKDYMPSGATALYDAVGGTIDVIGQELSALSEDERPDKVIFVITTDGEENSSRAFSKEMVRQRIEHQQSKYSWNFIFLGANIDAETEGTSLGIKQGYSKSYTANKVCTDNLYTAISNTVTSVRSACNAAEIDTVVTANLSNVQ